MKLSKKRWTMGGLLLCVLIALSNLSWANNLSQMQQQIKQTEAKVAEQRKQRNALQANLKKQENEIGLVSQQLKQTEMSLTEIRQAIQKTEQQIRKLEQQEKDQKEKLKRQLDSAYRSGIHPSVLERLLSDNAKDADRMGVYYEHINKVRLELIQDLRRTQQELKEQRDKLRSQQKGQQTELNTQKKQEQSLQKAKNERESTLRSLNKSLESEESRLEALRANERALRTQLEQASREAARKEQQALEKLEQKTNQEQKRQTTEQERQQVRAGEGLGSPQKQFARPVAGKILYSYGQSQGGELRWSGVVIQAGAGTPVRAIAGGRVIMSNWLEGYGQMVAIDHGKGYMSLYGYNQSVAVSVGSKVSAGQVISYVGNSGGQSRSSLYFEIRYKGITQNPMKWVK